MVDELDMIWRLGLALVLSSAIGLERELRQKSAGLRTYTLVGLGAALFMLVSQYGFADAIVDPRRFDPSRVAAQIVSGIGFIGAGLIFVRSDAVRGLTTAAGVWLTAAVGMAAGGSLPILAVVTTAIYFVVVFAYPQIARRLPRSGAAPSTMALTYRDGRGVLRRALELCTDRGFTVADLAVRRSGDGAGDGRAAGTASVVLEVQGTGSTNELAAELHDLDDMLEVTAGDGNDPTAD